jgi:CRP/FNR family transcriptional regulator, dissimilatory nitrate respiration regulator
MAVIDLIRNFPLFQGLPENQLAELTGIIMERNYERGEIIFSEGDEASGFFVLISGRLKIFKLSPEGKEQTLHFVEPQEPFAEVAMFAGSHYPAYAEALKESRAFFFPRAAFERLIKKDPDLAMNMLAILSQRLKYFSRLVEDLSLKEVPQRLAAYLLYLGGSDKGPSPIDLNISKGQLASLLGTIPETLSRILNKMTSRGFIEVKGRTMKLLNRNSLESLASGEEKLLL